MEYICIGDLHGKIEIAVDVLTNPDYDKYHKVFVGDFLDSFDRTKEDQIELLLLMLEAEERDDVTILIGNHELSYIKKGMRCSGYSWQMESHVSPHATNMFLKFKTHFYLADDILVTHAGANKQLFHIKEHLDTALETNDEILYRIGYARGGTKPYGGIFWNDFWEEHQVIPGLTQISGHTAHRPLFAEGVKGIVTMNGDFNIDCLDGIKELLIVDTEKVGNERFKIINMDTKEEENY